MTIFPVDIPVQNVHVFGMYFFGRKQNTGYVMIREDVPPFRLSIREREGGPLFGGSSGALREKIYSLISRSTIAVRAGM